jgi:hypothetical protein
MRVRTELPAATFASPDFRGGNERSADAAPPHVDIDIPALEESDRASEAFVRMRSESDLSAACQPTTRTRGDENHVGLWRLGVLA